MLCNSAVICKNANVHDVDSLLMGKSTRQPVFESGGFGDQSSVVPIGWKSEQFVSGM